MEIKTILIIVGLIATGLVIKACVPTTNKETQNTDRPTKTAKPTKTIENDKLVVVNDVTPNEIKQAIQQFCNIYNQESYRALPELTIVSDNEYVITFPNDIDFETFCYFVNYLHYPSDIFYKPNITAWTTTSQGDSWMKDELVGKKVMLYIPKDDQDYDNVYLTTSDNLGYKMGFALGEASQRLDNLRRTFQNPTIDLNKLEGRETVKFD
ncbi:MAG: hypothetical protein AAF944_25400 [Bacteroidota bacterium]